MASAKSKLEVLREQDAKMVRGMFHFYEVPGGTLSFSIKLHKNDPVKDYSLKDGGIYTIPLGVAKSLNNNCSYPVHKHAKDIHGNPSVVVGKLVKRCGFESMEFTDSDTFHEIGDGIQNKLVTVEKAL